MIHIDLDEEGVASNVRKYGQVVADGVVDLVSFHHHYLQARLMYQGADRVGRKGLCWGCGH